MTDQPAGIVLSPDTQSRKLHSDWVLCYLFYKCLQKSKCNLSSTNKYSCQVHLWNTLLQAYPGFVICTHLQTRPKIWYYIYAFGIFYTFCLLGDLNNHERHLQIRWHCQLISAVLTSLQTQIKDRDDLKTRRVGVDTAGMGPSSIHHHIGCVGAFQSVKYLNNSSTMAALNPPGRAFLCPFHQCPPDRSPNCLPAWLSLFADWLEKKPFSMLNVKVDRAILVITLHGRRSEKCPPQMAGVGEGVAEAGGKKTNLTKGHKQTNTYFSARVH